MSSEFTIATLGSHSALQILKGAKDEGFQTIAICKRGMESPYHQFKVADRIITLDHFSQFDEAEEELLDMNAIMIPHGSFIAYMGIEKVKNLKVHYYGNKAILDWEADRRKEMKWLKQAQLHLPRTFDSPEEIDRPVIVKFFGAGGGRGYFLAKDRNDFYQKYEKQVKSGIVEQELQYSIQEYVIGNPVYIHYFHSIIQNETEIMSFDRRYETNVDSIGRIPSKDQQELGIQPSYLVIGNTPLVVRESLLPEMIQMGERVVETSKEIVAKGLFGPFCLETIVTDTGKIVCFEISARIVAGTNPFVNGSPYTWLRYNEPMSTGRRIAREIKEAIQDNRINEVLS